LLEKLNKREIELLDLMRQYPLRIDKGVWILSETPKILGINDPNDRRTIIFRDLSTLEKIGLTEKQNNEIHLNHLGQKVAEYVVQERDQKLYAQSNSKAKSEAKLAKSNAKLTKSEAKLVKSNAMLELYRQGFSYQDIGTQYKISRERVRQLLSNNPDFHDYLREKEERQQAEAEAQEQAQEEKKKQKQLAKSLIVVYPEPVAELWDYEKNGDLSPADVGTGTRSLSPWFKCPIDGHSWQTKPNDISRSWHRGSSGCPKCAGKNKKSEKQPTLIEEYSEQISKYWDYEKNDRLGLNPSETTLSSNKRAWFRCPHDGNEWESRIVSTVNQQWLKGNTGCRVCNGTAERKRGEWSRREPIAIEFPDEIANYWFYEANDELKIDPMKLTTGSRKEAWFKCPIDGHEWISTLASIRLAWKNSNSGCPACRGLVTTETTSLISLYSDYVSEYWDYEKNNALEILPDKVTRGSQKEAWFKCPIDGYEWRTRIGSITKSAWSRGNSGCARCFGWSLEAIRQFVASLEGYIPNLTQAELYKIFEQSGALGTQNVEGLKIVKNIIRGKLSGQKIHDVIQGKEVKTSDADSISDDNIKADAELQIVDTANTSQTSNDFETNSDSSQQNEESSELPRIKIQKSLEFLNSQIVASADREAIDFFIASRRNRIWAEVFEDESAVESVEAFTEEGYGRQVRDQFLDEYTQAQNMQIPTGWGFRINGKITPPNLMQKLSAVRLRNQQRMLNLSLTGTGKTIGGILSSRIIDAHLTIIICPLDTIPNWHTEIKEVFPDSLVTTKNFNPHWIDIESGHHYIILNHEMFQQPSTPADIRQLLDRYQIDLIIVDEIHRCKHRNDDPSKRRQMVLALITNSTEKNPNLHVLGMSATPVINNLKEGKSLVELVTGVERKDLGEKATLNNCMRLHQAFATVGIRSKVKPKIKINKFTIPVDCTHLVDKIREEGTSIIKMEQILTSARIPTILNEIRPKTIVYTHYVEGIVDQLKAAIEGAGWTVGFHMGGDKSGRNDFINGSIDVLIASSAMATGVDGFQKVCDRLILNIPPWTSAELEQLEGRLNRQGQVHDTLTILMPVTYGLDDGEHWSWDEGRLARLQNKQTVADAAVDGVMPEGQLRTESQAFRDLRQWLERLKTGEQKPIVRPRIFVPLPDADPADVQRRNINYGDFSRMNARWNTSYSHTNYERLQNNPEEWMQYHTLYQEARKTWSVLPYQESIKWLQKRSGLVVGDFGCGEALISKALADKHTFHNYDFIAINDNVIECDVAQVPLEDSCLDVAIFNLSLMGLNSADYIREAARTLKLDGQLWIYEVTSHFKNLQEFLSLIERLGFRIIDSHENWKFWHIRAIKSE
jgi:hypothetical protein